MSVTVIVVGSAIRSARRAKCMRRSLAVPDDYGRPRTQTDRMGDAIGDRGSPAAGFDHHPSVCPPVAPAAESSCQTPADSTVYRGCGAKRRVGLAHTRSMHYDVPRVPVRAYLPAAGDRAPGHHTDQMSAVFGTGVDV